MQWSLRAVLGNTDSGEEKMNVSFFNPGCKPVNLKRDQVIPSSLRF
jgi:hypothetical protein